MLGGMSTNRPDAPRRENPASHCLPEPPADQSGSRIVRSYWSWALALGALASGCSLILDFSESSTNAQDAGQVVIDAFFASKCGAFEANNDLDNATAEADTGLPGTPVIASICAGTGTDFFSVTAPVDQGVTIALEYQGGGELGLRLHDPAVLDNDKVIKEIEGAGGMTSLSASSAELTNGALYAIEVYPTISNAETDYTLSIVVGP